MLACCIVFRNITIDKYYMFFFHFEPDVKPILDAKYYRDNAIRETTPFKITTTEYPGYSKWL